MTKKNYKAGKDKRVAGTFIALPRVVTESPGYRQASHTARSLLIDIAMQYRGDNNGKLTACAKYLKPLGWKSNDTIVRARRELLECGLLFEARKGARPNRAAWYALTWHAIDQQTGLDINPKLYRTGDYMRPEKPKVKNAVLVPSAGACDIRIAPPIGTSPSIHCPSGGAVQAPLPPWATPSAGTYLETPSALAEQRGMTVEAGAGAGVPA